jgi:hypothetical protein
MLLTTREEEEDMLEDNARCSRQKNK